MAPLMLTTSSEEARVGDPFVCSAIEGKRISRLGKYVCREGSSGTVGGGRWR